MVSDTFSIITIIDTITFTATDTITISSTDTTITAITTTNEISITFVSIFNTLASNPAKFKIYSDTLGYNFIMYFVGATEVHSGITRSCSDWPSAGSLWSLSVSSFV